MNMLMGNAAGMEAQCPKGSLELSIDNIQHKFRAFIEKIQNFLNKLPTAMIFGQLLNLSLFHSLSTPLLKLNKLIKTAQKWTSKSSIGVRKKKSFNSSLVISHLNRALAYNDDDKWHKAKAADDRGPKQLSPKNHTAPLSILPAIKHDQPLIYNVNDVIKKCDILHFLWVFLHVA